MYLKKKKNKLCRNQLDIFCICISAHEFSFGLQDVDVPGLTLQSAMTNRKFLNKSIKNNILDFSLNLMATFRALELYRRFDFHFFPSLEEKESKSKT